MHPLQKIQVLVVDDHPLFRRGVVWSLDAENDMTVIGEATDGKEAVDLSDKLAPDVIVLDINLPDLNGIEVARIVKRRSPRISIVIVTMHEDDEQLFNAIRVGAAAFCTKDVEPALIVNTIRRVARGEYLINENVLSHPFVASRVLDQFRELARIDHTNESVFSPLTPREV